MHSIAPHPAPAVAVPVFDGDDLSAFALYGLHRNGTKLDPDEIDTLEQLCSTAAQAYMRIENLKYRMPEAPRLRSASFDTSG